MLREKADFLYLEAEPPLKSRGFLYMWRLKEGREKKNQVFVLV